MFISLARFCSLECVIEEWSRGLNSYYPDQGPWCLPRGIWGHGITMYQLFAATGPMGPGAWRGLSTMFWLQHHPCCPIGWRGFWFNAGQIGVISHLPARIWAGLFTGLWQKCPCSAGFCTWALQRWGSISQLFPGPMGVVWLQMTGALQVFL